jgi:hypothetical protein
MAENEVFHRIRRENLVKMIHSEAEGNVAAFAKKHGLNQSGLNRYVAARATPKRIGYIAARKLEQDLGLEERALDRLPDGSFPDVPLLISPQTPDASVMLQQLASLSAAVPAMRRHVVAELVRQVVERPEASLVAELLREELERCLEATSAAH